jgi:UDP-N-acetylglucosamine:LPS N-acetylglucosamine transferase
MKNKRKKVLFVCNKGGHYMKILALQELFKDYDSRLLTSNTSVNKEAPIKHINIFLTKKDGKINYLLYIIQSIFVWFMFRPNVIISTGAFIAVPVFICGKLFGSKLIYIETNARVYSKSQTGKFLEPICDKFIVQWPEMKDVYKSAEYWGMLV